LPNGYRDKSLLNFFYNNIQSYNGNVPQRYRDKSMIQIYDDLNASPRYPQEILGVNLFKIKNRKVRTKSLINEKEKIVIYETPIGNLKEVIRGGYHTGFLVKNLSDVKIIKYILDDTKFEFDLDAFKIADREFGETGVVQSFYSQSPLQTLILSYMGFENTIYALNDYPDKMRDFLRIIEDREDKVYEGLCND